jgi:mono/diheme cytochrome c family protein
VATRLGILAVFCCLAVGAWLPGCGGNGSPLLTDHPGYTSYRKHCRKCHGGQGDGRRAARMAERPLDLGAIAYRDTVDATKVGRVVRGGRGRMKGYETKLDPKEIDTLVDYVLAMAEARRQSPNP